MGRAHVVLVPGFAGFDALGQLEYYAGTTPVFDDWRHGCHEGELAELHYFDNFPTAGVATRAERLRRYLAKRVARGGIQDEDTVSLVGHSTGGLDIRRLIWDLSEHPRGHVETDGMSVANCDLLRFIHRVVFLSVPHFGTNIAHWVRENGLGRRAVVAELRAAVGASQVPVVRRAEDVLASVGSEVLGLDLGRAVAAALHEAEPPLSGEPSAVADAQETASELALWLKHIATDFSAIDDLLPRESRRSEARDRELRSPPQFEDDERDREQTYWRNIQQLSFATRSASPFQFAGDDAPEWNWLRPWTWPDLTPRSVASAGTDATYRWCYRACAGGPFRLPRSARSQAPGLHTFDNDGIVNTGSMYWPDGDAPETVACDHMDIVGHFERPRNGHIRRYDLLGSASGFRQDDFISVWRRIFDFCAQ